MFWFFIIVFVIILYIFGPQIIWYIKKIFTPFSGRIENLEDVNGFLANYKIFEFDLHIDSDIGYVSSYIISVRQIRPGCFPKEKRFFVKNKTKTTQKQNPMKPKKRRFCPILWFSWKHNFFFWFFVFFTKNLFCFWCGWRASWNTK